MDRLSATHRSKRSGLDKRKRQPDSHPVKEDECEANQLKEELISMKQMLEHLSLEKKQESYDERRSFAMKSQIFQLERQCALMQQSLSIRATSVTDTETELSRLAEYFQSLLEGESSSGPVVLVPRSDLTQRIHTLHKLRHSLRKQRDLSHGGSDLEMPILPVSKFATSPVTCLDVCSARTKPLNLQNVARLEEDLNKLRKNLVKLQTSLQCTLQGGDQCSESFLCTPTFKRITSISGECCEQLEDCSQDLLALSLLHPNAPWKVTQDPKSFGVFDPNRINSSVFEGGGQLKKAKHAINSMCKAHSYLMELNKEEIDAMKCEVDYCKELNRQQIHFTNSLLYSVRASYKNCEENLKHAVVGPMREVYDAWMMMKRRQSDDTLRHFLSTMASNEQLLGQLLPSHNDDDDDDDVGDAFKEFGEKLAADLQSLQLKCSQKRAERSRKIRDFRNENESALVDAMRTLTF